MRSSTNTSKVKKERVIKIYLDVSVSKFDDYVIDLFLHECKSVLKKIIENG